MQIIRQLTYQIDDDSRYLFERFYFTDHTLDEHSEDPASTLNGYESLDDFSVIGEFNETDS